MAHVRCAISGVLFECSYMPKLRLPSSEGFPHPIFAANKSYLQQMYIDHCAGKLQPIDSYLLFMAILHSSGNITWNHNSTLEPTANSTQTMIENNISQLITVISKTEQIRHPRFKQPKYVVRAETANLSSVSSWIKAWQDNLDAFYAQLASNKERQDLTAVENKLAKLIFSYQSTQSYAKVIADWADKATGGFPAEHKAQWKEIITNCYNDNKMFRTNIETLHKLKEFCCANLEIGSIYFSELMQCLNEGISRHTNYLGGSLFDLGYSLVPLEGTQEHLDSPEGKKLELGLQYKLSHKKELAKEAEESLNKLIADSPLVEPVRSAYNDSLSFVQAKIAYRLAKEAKKAQIRKSNSLKGL